MVPEPNGQGGPRSPVLRLALSVPFIAYGGYVAGLLLGIVFGG